ncbi:universal stress protein [Micromonospora endophytica]|uniref:Universal stress protein UspA n=1 Tax=Micromonospora endophytica TaxID=515350 RepID=A0A2W2BPB5_9ACTN|nr:universal stress protein [Micromonospora endophytica]PZF88995.1 universal stress protein UspA [Micromonospora endophytica]RIW41249.1 universal stress protein [Micromonospora endophytica]BCJ57645.1 universal stress protein [Micromonospora endophytica]
MAAAATRQDPLIVGVGPEDVQPVVRLAAQVAAAHDRGLHLLHAFNWAAMQAPAVSGSRTDAEQLIAQATTEARAAEPDLTVTTEIVEGPAVANLVRRSESAFLVAIGDGGMAHCGRCIPADSPAVQVAARAECPVLIVRREPPPRGPVLVGVDGSASSEAALAWALACAAQHRARLLAIWVVHDDAEVEQAGDRLRALVSRWSDIHPGVAVECHAMCGDPGGVLVDQSRSAQLAVVAARGDEPWRGMLGAVSQSLLYHAPAPVIVVRGGSGPPAPAGHDGPDGRDQRP